MISAKVIADSYSPSDIRLTTIQLEYPRFIHSEVMTHRVMSRNAASSRAIPVKKFIERIQADPAMPVFWGANRPGMQSKEELTGDDLEFVKRGWLMARDLMADMAQRFQEKGLHKQIANRILEPWMHMVTVMTATEWGNLLNLRCHEDAQPEFLHLAEAILKALNESEPVALDYGEWHLPYVLPEERSQKHVSVLKKLSTARAARVSYLNHDGTSPDIEKDIELHDALIKAPHASPFEHQATPLTEGDWCGNFRGWFQYRKEIQNENRPVFDRLIKKPRRA